MLIITFIIVLLYLLLIGSLIYGFDKVSDFKLEDISPKTKFSVIVPFRNEAENLPTLLKSIANLNYPKSMFEILFIDDDSTDFSVEIITKEMLKLRSVDVSVEQNLRRTTSPKKDAITTAIRQAKYEWIITTDADCQLPKYWLDAFDGYIQHHHPKMVIAPVTFKTAASFFERFQLLDILSLQGATIGGFGIDKPFLCNGANFGYQKTLFNDLNGFEGNSDVASGDDIFLLEKALKRDNNSVHYIKNNQVVVHTSSQPNIKALIAQRVRWAAKTSRYRNRFGKFTGLIVLLMNVLVVSLPLLYMLQITSATILIYTFAIKFLIDFLLLFKTTRFFGQDRYLPSFVFSSILYPFFSVYVAFISVFKGYKWKDRAYTK